MPNNLCDIYIVGTGMVGTRQITNEVNAAFEASSDVFTVVLQSDVLERYLEDYDVEVTDLRKHYQEGKKREHSYREMAKEVLDTAEKREKPVTLALYGHPFVFVSPSRMVVEKASERELTVEKRPGISSMDCLYSDVTLDPGANGIQMYGATDLLVHEYEPDPRVPMMIWQIGVVENIWHTTAKSDPSQFSRIRKYLQEFYPDNHEVNLLQTATYPFIESEQIVFELGEFEEMADQINAVQTLYVPPIEKQIVNKDLDKRIRQSEHLDTITRPDRDTT